MPDKRLTFGQFDTPPDVADLLLGCCQRSARDTVLDPSCGGGALLERAARRQAWLAGPQAATPSLLWGVELEKAAVQAARRALPGATIRHHNFFTLPVPHLFDAIVGNPPYTRAEWIGRLPAEAGRQLPLFEQPPEQNGRDKRAVLPDHLLGNLSRRAGLYAYFFLHGARFLREGGRFGFVVPNNWADVAYSEALKKFLLDRYRIVALIEPTNERWFDEARVNTSLVILERCANPGARDGNPVHFVRLRRPLGPLLGIPAGDDGRFARVDELISELFAGRDRTSEEARIRVVEQKTLDPEEKWGIVWRAPAAYRRARRRAHRKRLVPLKSWATVRRGFTTGANEFFYLDAEAVDRWEIEARFRQPLLKSLRRTEHLRLTGAACEFQVFSVPPTARLAGTRAAAYIAWGEDQQWHRRTTCASRRPWYSLPWQEPAPLVLPKGIWSRHLAPLLEEPIQVDQQLYQIQLAPGVPRLAAAALLNSSWAALQMELQGRRNFGEGVLWLAGYEVQNLLLPDPRLLEPEQTDALASFLTALAREPVAADVESALVRPAQKALDDLVFRLVGFGDGEATVLLDTLLEQTWARRQRARPHSPDGRFSIKIETR